MAINNESLVKFGYGFDSSTSKETGMISFDPSSQAIYVGNDGEAVLVTSSVKDASFKDSVLTITKVGGEVVTLDFSDVASANQTTKILGTLRTDVNAIRTDVDDNATAIETLSTTVSNLDTFYKAADTKIREDFAAADTAINDKIGTVAEGKTVVGLIEEAKEAANAAHSVVAKDSSFLTLNTSTAENGAITYTLGTSDIASATDLLDVSTKANAAATNVDFEAYKTSNNAAVAKNARDISDVSTLLNDFLTGTDTDDVVNKLSDIKKWMDTTGSDVTDLTEAIADEASTRATEDTSVYNAAKTYANGLAVNYDAAGAAATAESNAKAYSDTNLATAKTYAEGQASAAQTAAINDATIKANAAETNAKGYADAQIMAIKVNGVTIKDASLDGTHIKVGGEDTYSSATVSYAIEDLYTQVQAASKAGVQSLAVDSSSSNYAEVSGTTGAVTLTIKKVALADATESNTGVADAWDVKESIRVAKEGAISTVQGAEGDTSADATVAGAKAYAKDYTDAQIEANALRWTVL